MSLIYVFVQDVKDFNDMGWNVQCVVYKFRILSLMIDTSSSLENVVPGGSAFEYWY